MISILILGTGGAVPTPTRTPAGCWVEADGRGVLVDPGPGALNRLVAHPAGPGTLDAVETVLCSHLHPDHCADLVPLLFALHSIVLDSTAPLRLIGPPGFAAYLTRLAGLYGDWLVPRRRELLVEETRPGDRIELGAGAAVEVFEAAHFERRFSACNLLFRFRDGAGHSLVFGGDGGDGPGLRAAATEADLLLVECSTPDALAVEGHLSPSSVAELCAATRPRRVVLTHFYPQIAELDAAAGVRERCTVDVVMAGDGDRYAVPLDPPVRNGKATR